MYAYEYCMWIPRLLADGGNMSSMLFLGARSARLFKGVHGLLLNVGPLRRRSTFNPTMDELPD